MTGLVGLNDTCKLRQSSVTCYWLFFFFQQQFYCKCFSTLIYNYSCVVRYVSVSFKLNSIGLGLSLTEQQQRDLELAQESQFAPGDKCQVGLVSWAKWFKSVLA